MNTVKMNDLKNLAHRLPFFRMIRRGYKGISHLFVDEDAYTLEDEYLIINQAPPIIMNWPTNTPKPSVGLVREYGEALNHELYWPKYERFLQNNHIPYGYIDIHQSSFLEQADQHDVIIWRTLNDPASQWEAETKLSILQNEKGKLCLPSMKELWFYEDKIHQYYLMQINDLPIANTFITYSKEEAMAYIRQCTYPLVSKITTGSGSQGVKLVKNAHQAETICRKVFNDGQPTYWSYVKQKDYVYFQDFIEDAVYDLRVIVVGNSFLGYYRNTPSDDFRASGHGDALVEKKAIPKEALLLAKKVKDTLPPTRILAIDMLENLQDGQYHIIETSIFVGVYTPVQLMVDGIPGRYVFENGEFRFEEGKWWIQELALVELFKEWIGASV